ncbi:MAG: TauD/TfdA dioxygenase family protein [Rhodospirillales bacterium]|jgi:taurine dioxygenase
MTTNTVTKTPATLHIRKLSPHIGAEATGVDLRDINTEEAHLLNQAVLDNVCMVIRDQHLTPEEFESAASIFGEVMDQDHPRYSFPGMPGIKRYSNFDTDIEGNRMKGSGHWHTDGSFREQPPKFVLLYAVEIPDNGGETEVVNMRAGYQSLPEETRRKLEPMKTAHVRASSSSRTDVGKNNLAIMAQGDQVPNFHPLVRTIEGAAEKSLYFSPPRVEYIAGMDPEASQDLLHNILDKVIRPEFIYTHKWRLGDIFMWDNRASLHRAVYNYDWNQHRLMYHATILGERPQ